MRGFLKLTLLNFFNKTLQCKKKAKITRISDDVDYTYDFQPRKVFFITVCS